MADLWGSLIGAVGSIYADKQNEKKQDKQNDFTASQNPNTTQQASLWQQQQNLGNQSWAQGTNQYAMDRAGRGTNSGAFGTATRSQNPDGTWATTNTLNSGDQSTLDALRGNALTGAKNLDMSGNYNVNSDYARNYDALNRPALERNQEAQRTRAAAMGLGWGSGEANNTLTGQLNDEQTRFGMATQNAGHDAWLQDQNNLRSNIASGDASMSGIANRQTAAPEWGKYATVNAPTSALVNKGGINSSLGWGTLGSGENGGSTNIGGQTYTDWTDPVANPGWTGGSLYPGGSGGNNGTLSGNYDNRHTLAGDALRQSDVTYDANGNPQSLGQAFENGIGDISDLYNGWQSSLDGATGGWGGTILGSVLPGFGGMSALNAVNGAVNPRGSFYDQTRYNNGGADYSRQVTNTNSGMNGTSDSGMSGSAY